MFLITKVTRVLHRGHKEVSAISGRDLVGDEMTKVKSGFSLTTEARRIFGENGLPRQPQSAYFVFFNYEWHKDLQRTQRRLQNLRKDIFLTTERTENIRRERSAPTTIECLLRFFQLRMAQRFAQDTNEITEPQEEYSFNHGAHGKCSENTKNKQCRRIIEYLSNLVIECLLKVPWNT